VAQNARSASVEIERLCSIDTFDAASTTRRIVAIGKTRTVDFVRMELLLFIACAALAVWGLAYLRWAGLWGYVLATLIAGTVFGHPFFHISAITSDRVLLVLCLVLLVVYRHLGLLERVAWHWIDSVVIWFISAMIVTTFMHDWRADGAAPASKLIFFYLLPVCMYWLGRRLEITPVRLRWMYATFACLGLYLAITAVFEKYGLGAVVFPRYIVDPKYAEFLGRGRGPLLNPTGNGVLLTLGLSCALMFFPGFGKIGRWAVASSIPVYLLGIYCTLTRCVWIGGAAALVGITWVATPKRFRIPFAIVLLFGGGLLVAMKSDSFVGFKRDKNVSVADMKQSAHLRPILAAFAWKMFQDYPITGCGTGQYLENVKYYMGERNVDLPLGKAKAYVQHNVFLALIAENGIFGMIPFAILLVWSTRYAWRLWRAEQIALEYRQAGLVFLGFMAAYIANGLFHDLLIVPMVGMYLFFHIGFIRNLAGKHILPTEASTRGWNPAVSEMNRRAADRVPSLAPQTQAATAIVDR
jgi:O-Antigen ligase